MVVGGWRLWRLRGGTYLISPKKLMDTAVSGGRRLKVVGSWDPVSDGGCSISSFTLGVPCILVIQ